MPSYSKAEQLKGSKKKVKKKSRSKLVKELDRVFSIFIRQRDLPGGRGKCYTCKNPVSIRDAHAMHFISRACYRYRWDEDNVKAGCQRCNIWLKGNYIEYVRYMIDEYGIDKVDEMRRNAKQVFKISTQEIEDKIAYYKRRIGE